MIGKIVFFILLLCLPFCLVAQNRLTFKQAKISFKAKNLNAGQIFTIIDKKTAYHVCYSPNDVSPKLLLNLEYKNQPLTKVLRDLAIICNLRFYISKKNINVALNDPPNNQIILIKQ